MSGEYGTAQICLNGHVANSSTKGMPQLNQKFCEKCGAQTITKCQHCNSPIRGADLLSEFGWLGYRAPNFCIHCGQSFPWTEAKIAAANELAKEFDSLDENDRAVLKQSIDDLIRETPATTTAAVRLKRIMAKAGQGAASMFREILVDVLSETARKMLWP